MGVQESRELRLEIYTKLKGTTKVIGEEVRNFAAVTDKNYIKIN